VTDYKNDTANNRVSDLVLKTADVGQSGRKGLTEPVFWIMIKM
jgi:hypothetical protein